MSNEKGQRQVNLVLALKELPRPMTLEQLRARVPQLYPQSDPESARRQFERDKKDLLAIGVPIEHRRDGGEDTYTIDRRAYGVPDIDLDPEEVAALVAALRGADAPAIHGAIDKLTAAAPDGKDEPGLVARLDVGDAPTVLAGAVRERRIVRFRYRPVGKPVSERTVCPYAVRVRRGVWYLRARDQGDGVVKSFRVGRIEGEIRVGDGRNAFPRPDPADLVLDLPAGERVDVHLAVGPSASWTVSLRGGVVLADDEHQHKLAPADVEAGWRVFVVRDVDTFHAVHLILGLGPRVEVLAPPEVRRRVVEALERITGADA